MSTEATWQISTSSVEDTLALGALVGAQLKGGEVIELLSDVGGGKTTFVRGIADGAGSKDHVSSPSFTISNIYKTDVMQIVHFDFYRLHDAGIIAAELQDILEDTTNVIVVEWAGLIADVLPNNRLKIKIIPLNEASRQFEFTYSDDFHGLVNTLKRNSGI